MTLTYSPGATLALVSALFYAASTVPAYMAADPKASRGWTLLFGPQLLVGLVAFVAGASREIPSNFILWGGCTALCGFLNLCILFDDDVQTKDPCAAPAMAIIFGTVATLAMGSLPDPQAPEPVVQEATE